jgi:hypothetical protein
VVRDGGLAEADRLDEIADARLLTLGCRDDRHEAQARRIGERLQPAGERLGVGGRDGLAGERCAAHGIRHRSRHGSGRCLITAYEGQIGQGHEISLAEY